MEALIVILNLAITASALGLSLPMGPTLGMCSNSATGSGSEIFVTGECASPSGGAGGGSNGSSSNEPAPFEAYEWRLACGDPNAAGATSRDCPEPDGCPADTRPYVQFGLKDGQWHAIYMSCRSESTPTITPALLTRAFQRIPLPHLRTVAQPAAKTLVNFDTIFHVEAVPLTRQVTLLGQRIELQIEPTSFAWDWGDGKFETTTTAGAPYPSRSVVHRYFDAGVTVRARVTVTWTARWRTNSGPWADVPGSVRTTGPAARLRVLEAVPHLAGTG